MKVTLSIVVIILFVFGYRICSFFYDPCVLITKWWDLRMNIYAIILLLCFIIAIPNIGNKFLRFTLCIGVGLSSADVIDRVWFDITKFTKDDVIMILTTITLSYIEVYTQLSNKLKLFMQKLCRH